MSDEHAETVDRADEPPVASTIIVTTLAVILGFMVGAAGGGLVGYGELGALTGAFAPIIFGISWQLVKIRRVKNA